MKVNKDSIQCCDAVHGISLLPDDCIDCCVTSPPYYGLRDYGVEGQIGLELSPGDYVRRLVTVFAQVHRVLKPSGTLWLNIGDSYAGSGKGAWKNKQGQKEIYTPSPGDKLTKMPKIWEGIKPKDMIGIPWTLAFALRDYGWYLRQDIIWHKPNAMPESVKDRCTTSHEHVFLLSKSANYYYDANSIKVNAKTHENRPHGIVRNRVRGYASKQHRHPEAYLSTSFRPQGIGDSHHGESIATKEQVNKRDVWSIPTRPHKEQHFAMFPEEMYPKMPLSS